MKLEEKLFIEKKSENTHSLTVDETTQILKNKSEIAYKSIVEYRKNYITQLLKQKNVDMSNINIDDIVNGNIPGWIINMEKCNNSIDDKIMASFLGFIVGDALGVPLEFLSRDFLSTNFVNDMIGYGSHNMPEGTWSDDTSLTIATIDSIIQCGKIDYEDIMKKFLSWFEENNYTADNLVFDIGVSTRKALINYKNGNEPIKCGGKHFYDNGNGSLMRMLPFVFIFYSKDYSFLDSSLIIDNISSLTHGNEISCLGCRIYIDYLNFILNGYDKLTAIELLSTIDYSIYYSKDSILYYKNILGGELKNMNVKDIKSSGFIIDTLEASLWCTITSNSYQEAVLKAINLGNDTDTIGAITGSINGILYGIDSIPTKWINKLKRIDYLQKMIINFSHSIKKNVKIK